MAGPMIGTTAWLVATIALLPALAVPVIVALRSTANHRLVGVQVASTLAALMLATMSFAFDQSSFIDLALGAILLGVPGTLLFAAFMERWI